MKQNNQGSFAPSGPNRTSQIITTILPAGATLPIFQAGDEFYIVVATAALKIKPNNGSENEYVQGTGLKVNDQNIFANLQVRNDNPFNTVVQIFVGFGGYIDNRLITSDPNNYQAPYATYPIPNSAGTIDIPDLSGQAFIGVDGKTYLALSRRALYVSNLTLADTYNLQGIDGLPGSPLYLLGVFPQTSIVYEASGHLQIKVPSGNINALVSEVYNSILG